MTEQPAIQIGVVIFLVLYLAWLGKQLFMRRQRDPPDKLDQVLFEWVLGCPFTLRSLLEGIAVYGRSGSGKSSSSGKLLAKAIIKNLPNSGGLVLCQKPEDLDFWTRIFTAAGRKDDMIVFAPDQPWRFNFLDYVTKTWKSTAEVTRCITTIAETLRSSGSGGQEDGEFWEAEQSRMIFNAVEIIKLGLGKVSAPYIQTFIGRAAMNAAQIGTAEWQAGFHNQTLKKAYEASKTPIAALSFCLFMRIIQYETIMSYPTSANGFVTSVG